MQDIIRTYSNDYELVASRRAHIARCAAHLFVIKGYDRTSVQEVADACGMAIGTLYRYVGKKEDILYLVLDHGLSPFVKLCDDFFASLDTLSATEALQQAIEKYYRMLDELQDIIRMAYQEIRYFDRDARRPILDTDRRFVAIFEGLLTRGCATGEFSIHSNVTVVAHSILVLGHMWGVRQWFLRSCCTAEEYIREISELILDAICGDKGIVSEG